MIYAAAGLFAMAAAIAAVAVQYLKPTEIGACLLPFLISHGTPGVIGTSVSILSGVVHSAIIQIHM